MQKTTSDIKKGIVITLMLFTPFLPALRAQELPMINPGLTNSLLYNPSIAGSSSASYGSIWFIHRESFIDVSGHPACDILSAQLPFRRYRFGLGANFLLDRANVLKTAYGSFAFAFHIPFENYSKLSLGLSGSLQQTQLDYSKVQVLDESRYDLIINEYNDGKLSADFSFGINYRTRRLTVGGTINNLASSGIFHQDANTALLNYYSAYLKYALPLFNQYSQIEPFITYRKLPLSVPKADIGCYYLSRMRNSVQKVRDIYLTAGMAVGTNLDLNFSLGISIRKRIRIMYNYEIPGTLNHYVGSSHEIFLQYDVVNQSNQEEHSEYLNWDHKKKQRNRK